MGGCAGKHPENQREAPDDQVRGSHYGRGIPPGRVQNRSPSPPRCCPTGASHITEGGIVLVNPKKCIGCGACIASCPYDARYPHPEGYVDKCTFCIHRVKQGMKPSCVSVCPTKCMYFGDLDDPNSDVSQVLKKRKHKTLIPEAGTQPQLYFLI